MRSLQAANSRSAPSPIGEGGVRGLSSIETDPPPPHPSPEGRGARRGADARQPPAFATRGSRRRGRLAHRAANAGRAGTRR
jgi:hypothetical protein